MALETYNNLDSCTVSEGADGVVEDLSETHGNAVAYGSAFRTHPRVTISYTEGVDAPATGQF
jgi:hypothetical protein